MLSAESDEIKKAYKELVDMTPAPMNTMLEKQPRNEAIKKMIERKEMVVANVPPTAGTVQVNVYCTRHCVKYKQWCDCRK